MTEPLQPPTRFWLNALPKPFYDADGITLYHGDALAMFGELPMVDLVIADPPYGETSLAWDRWVPDWPHRVGDLLKDTGSLWCFGSFRMFMTRIGEFYDYLLAQEIVWEKHNGSNFHADRFRRVHELAVQWYRGWWGDIYKSPVTTLDATARTVRRKGRPNHLGAIADSTFVAQDGGPRLMRSVIRVRSCHGEADHPTQKPLGILEPLIRYSCPPDGLILDPFAGAGSTLVVAKQLGLRAIGIEAQERFCAAAVRRLSQGVLPLAAALEGETE